MFNEQHPLTIVQHGIDDWRKARVSKIYLAGLWLEVAHDVQCN